MGKVFGKLDYVFIVVFEVGVMKRDEEEMENIFFIEIV